MSMWICDRLHELSIVFYFENWPEALWLLLFHFLPGSICSVEIDAVHQQLVSKIEVLRNDRDAAENFRSAGSPVGMVSLIRVAEISSGDRAAAVTWRLCPRWKSGVMLRSLTVGGGKSEWKKRNLRPTCARATKLEKHGCSRWTTRKQMYY